MAQVPSQSPAQVKLANSASLFKTRKQRAEEILARPNATNSLGMINPRVVSREEAGIIANYRASQAPGAAEQRGPVAPPTLFQQTGVIREPTKPFGTPARTTGGAIKTVGSKVLDAFKVVGGVAGPIAVPIVEGSMRAQVPAPIRYLQQKDDPESVMSGKEWLKDVAIRRNKGDQVLKYSQQLLSGDIGPKEWAGEMIKIQESKGFWDQMISELPIDLIPGGVLMKGPRATVSGLTKIGQNAIRAAGPVKVPGLHRLTEEGARAATIEDVLTPRLAFVGEGQKVASLSSFRKKITAAYTRNPTDDSLSRLRVLEEAMGMGKGKTTLKPDIINNLRRLTDDDIDTLLKDMSDAGIPLNKKETTRYLNREMQSRISPWDAKVGDQLNHPTRGDVIVQAVDGDSLRIANRDPLTGEARTGFASVQTVNRSDFKIPAPTAKQTKTTGKVATIVVDGEPEYYYIVEKSIREISGVLPRRTEDVWQIKVLPEFDRLYGRPAMNIGEQTYSSKSKALDALAEQFGDALRKNTDNMDKALVKKLDAEVAPVTGATRQVAEEIVEEVPVGTATTAKAATGTYKVGDVIELDAGTVRITSVGKGKTGRVGYEFVRPDKGGYTPTGVTANPLKEVFEESLARATTREIVKQGTKEIPDEVVEKAIKNADTSADGQILNTGDTFTLSDPPPGRTQYEKDALRASPMYSVETIGRGKKKGTSIVTIDAGYQIQHVNVPKGKDPTDFMMELKGNPSATDTTIAGGRKPKPKVSNKKVRQKVKKTTTGQGKGGRSKKNTAEAGEKPLPEVVGALGQATTIVARDKPGLIQNIMDSMAGMKFLLRKVLPKLEMDDPTLIAWVAEGNVRASAGAALDQVRIKIMNQWIAEFGIDVVRGTRKADIQYIGTDQLARKNYKGTGTLYDILQNPQLYDLTTPQRKLIRDSQSELNAIYKKVISDYGVDIGIFPPKPGGVFLSNIDIAGKADGSLDDGLNRLFGSPVYGTTKKSGRAKRRYYETGLDRWKARSAKDAPDFEPMTDLFKLLGVEMHGTYAKMAGRSVFSAGVPGLTRAEVIARIGTAEAKKLLTNINTTKKRLQTLQSSLRKLNNDAADSIDDFLKSAQDEADLDEIIRLMEDFKVSPGRYVAKDATIVGMTAADLQKEIKSVRQTLKVLRKSYDTVEITEYRFVKDGMFKYYPIEQADHIERLNQVNDSQFWNVLNEVRATAFGGDLSPISIQGMQAWLYSPLQMSKFLWNSGTGWGNFSGRFTVKALMDDMAANPESWDRFIKGTGLNPLEGVQQEFGVGYVGKIKFKGIGKKWTEANEAVYRPITRMAKDLFDSNYDLAIAQGYDEMTAIAIAADDATKLVPRIAYRRLGQSAKQAAMQRGMLTSVSFLVQPTALTIDAAKGLMKWGLRRNVTMTENLAIRRILNFASTTSALSVSSAIMYAKMNDNPEVTAMREARNALDPRHPNFMAITMPNGMRLSIGGPIRSLLRAIAPRPVKVVGLEDEIPLPFAGIMKWGGYKLGPGLNSVVDLIQDKDFYGREIATGDFPISILQQLSYFFSTGVPLVGQSAVRAGVRAATSGEGMAEFEGMGTEILGQAGGVNLVPFDSVYQARLRWTEDIDAYREIRDLNRDKVQKAKLNPISTSAFRSANPDLDAKLFITGEGGIGSLGERAIKYAVRLMLVNKIALEDVDSIVERQEFIEEYIKVNNKRPSGNNIDELIKQYNRQKASLERNIISKPMQRPQPSTPTPAGDRGLTPAGASPARKPEGYWD